MTAFPASPFPALLVGLPVLMATLSLFFRSGRKALVGLTGSLLTTALALIAFFEVMRQGTLIHILGGWEPPLGILLRMDPLAAVFIGMTAVVGVFISLYAWWYFRAQEAATGGFPLFWPLWLFLWAGLNGLFLSNDLFNLFVTIEVVGICAVALAVLSGKKHALVAGLRYLLAAIAGSMAYLFGTALLYGSTGALDLGLLGQALEPGATTTFALVVITLGLMIKMAGFPFHFWLPPAHSSALAPVSALLSALVVKGAFYILLRLWMEVFGVSLAFAAGQLIGVAGAVAVIWGSWQAFMQTNLKLIVAHSSVAQLGYLLMIFPLLILAPGVPAGSADWLSPVWTAGVYQVMAHAFAKASFFLSAGIIIIAIGHDRIASLRNLAVRMPMTVIAIGIAGVSLIGLPPSGGFIAKWMLLQGIFLSGQWWWAPVVLAGSLLAAGYVFRIMRLAFAPAHEKEALRPVPKALQLCALLLALGSFLIVLPAEHLIQFLESSEVFGSGIESLVEGGDYGSE
ncbi:MAG: proton-conducting transporter membrane subunit [Bacteroidales bacterium]|nr:proton-conducting transporter membrane subunit [Bacteroidales bacterium]